MIFLTRLGPPHIFAENVLPHSHRNLCVSVYGSSENDLLLGVLVFGCHYGARCRVRSQQVLGQGQGKVNIGSKI